MKIVLSEKEVVGAVKDILKKEFNKNINCHLDIDDETNKEIFKISGQPNGVKDTFTFDEVLPKLDALFGGQFGGKIKNYTFDEVLDEFGFVFNIKDFKFKFV